MTTRTREHAPKPLAAKVSLFEEIEEPGAYLSNWSGHLIRVPDNGLKAGSSPKIGIVGKEPMVVTKLSDDPFCTISRARHIAADLDLEVNF